MRNDCTWMTAIFIIHFNILIPFTYIISNQIHFYCLFNCYALNLFHMFTIRICLSHFGRPRPADHEVKRRRPFWPWWNPVSTKNTKISQVWWHTPVVLATWEAEAEESLESRRQRLQWAKTMPLHYSKKARLCLKIIIIIIKLMEKHEILLNSY